MSALVVPGAELPKRVKSSAGPYDVSIIASSVKVCSICAPGEACGAAEPGPATLELGVYVCKFSGKAKSPSLKVKMFGEASSKELPSYCMEWDERLVEGRRSSLIAGVIGKAGHVCMSLKSN